MCGVLGLHRHAHDGQRLKGHEAERAARLGGGQGGVFEDVPVQPTDTAHTPGRHLVHVHQVSSHHQMQAANLGCGNVHRVWLRRVVARTYNVHFVADFQRACEDAGEGDELCVDACAALAVVCEHLRDKGQCLCGGGAARPKRPLHLLQVRLKVLGRGDITWYEAIHARSLCLGGGGQLLHCHGKYRIGQRQPLGHYGPNGLIPVLVAQLLGGYVELEACNDLLSFLIILIQQHRRVHRPDLLENELHKHGLEPALILARQGLCLRVEEALSPVLGPDRLGQPLHLHARPDGHELREDVHTERPAPRGACEGDIT
mmetsp:Transcript_45649/g.111139  ORF Transcript_45649/g.111139 Transcript_45649/m.111139 type:complete len:315 (-) Transcript_45649:794-1738(-)